MRRFPDGARDYRVSIDGGETPLWSRDGRELLYRRGDAVLAASLRIVGDEISAERPRELFRGDYVSSENHTWSYDPTTDELIMIRRGEHEISRDRFVVVIDWPSELAGRTPERPAPKRHAVPGDSTPGSAVHPETWSEH